jgi:hypothetical protein
VTGEVEHRAGDRRHRQHAGELLERVGLGARVAQRVAQLEHSGRPEPQLAAQLQARVARAHLDRPAGFLE